MKILLISLLLGSLLLSAPKEEQAVLAPIPPIAVRADTVIAPIVVKKAYTLRYTPIVASTQVIEYTEEIFGSNSKVMLAVLKHESGLVLNKKGWNCRYNGKSKSCKPEDRNLAWSVDCGIGQINVKGKECPSYLFTLEGNMKAVEKIYKTQGMKAWVSYTSGAYKKFL